MDDDGCKGEPANILAAGFTQLLTHDSTGQIFTMEALDAPGVDKEFG